MQGKQCASGDRRATPSNSVLSPDGKRAAFIRDYNLWVRDVATGTDKQLTTDGVKDFGYATDNAGWIRSDRPIVLWSPDSKKIATFQQDERGVGEMYLVNTTVGHPTLQAWKYPLPGDAVITTIQRVIIDVDGPKVDPAADARRPASLDALRRRDVRRRVGRRAVEARRQRSRVRVDLARSPGGDAARRRRGDRRVPRRAQRKGRDVLRIRQRQGQLALPPELERSDLVFAARQLGPPLSVRPPDRAAEEPDHDRRRQRDAARARGRRRSRPLLRRRRPRDGAAIPTSVISIASAWTARARSC